MEKEWKAIVKLAVTETLFVAGFCLWLTAVGLAQTGTPQTKTQLNTETTTNFPDNNTGLITPLIARQSFVDYVSSWQQAPRVRSFGGTSDAIVIDDYGKLVTYNNSSPVAVTIPQATTTFATFNFLTCNKGAGTLTFTPTTSNINGNATLALTTGQCAIIVSDATNYQSMNVPSLITASAATAQTTPQNCGLTASVATNLLTVTLTDINGNAPSASSPCVIPFRSATATTGQWVNRSVTAATTISTFATGATLGSVNAQAFRFWVVAFDNAGTVVLSLFNAWNDSTTALNQAFTCSPIDETQVQSSTAISGAATSSGVYYTPNGTTLTNNAIRILGYVEYNSTGLVTAGTYATAPNFVQMFDHGIRGPCEVLRTVSMLTTSNSSTTGGPIATTVNNTITPTSAANRIKIETQGTVGDNSTGTTNVTLYRGANACTTQITGNMAISNTAATAITSPFARVYVDHPNTVASQGYTECLTSTNAQTSNFPIGVTSAYGMMYLTELMG